MNTINLTLRSDMFNKILLSAQREGISIDEAITKALRIHFEGACPHCGEGPVEQMNKHHDLLMGANAVSSDYEYQDVTIYKCERCGKYHADVENYGH